MLYFGTTTKMGIMHNAPNYLQNAKYISKYTLVMEKELQDVDCRNCSRSPLYQFVNFEEEEPKTGRERHITCKKIQLKFVH